MLAKYMNYVTGIRLTDSEGLDRKIAPCRSLTMASNAIALVEIQKK